MREDAIRFFFELWKNLFFFFLGRWGGGKRGDRAGAVDRCMGALISTLGTLVTVHGIKK